MAGRYRRGAFRLGGPGGGRDRAWWGCLHADARDDAVEPLGQPPVGPCQAIPMLASTSTTSRALRAINPLTAMSAAPRERVELSLIAAGVSSKHDVARMRWGTPARAGWPSTRAREELWRADRTDKVA